jgi:hypothetical protein
VGALVSCAPKTGLILEVQGPTGTSTITAGVATLRLVSAHQSYCGRWVTTPELAAFTVDVHNRDLTEDPVTILLSPDTHTDLDAPVRAQVLALDASGQLIGVAGFSAEPFKYEEVRTYAARIALLGRGARSDGPKYVADDGCVCIPGLPYIGTSTGMGCDQKLPPSLDDYISTAGCELPAGASLPVGICDGQLYPGERANRELPCYAARNGACRIGQRICNDQFGRGYDRECSASDPALTLPSTALCDATLTCERVACGDPLACLKTSALTHKVVHCKLPLGADPLNGAAQPCNGGSWSFTVSGAPMGSACVAAMLDGTRVGPITLGWKKDGVADPQVTSAQCPPTVFVSAVDVATPAAAVGSYALTVSIGDQIYDVELEVDAVCPMGGEARNFRCDVL